MTQSSLEPLVRGVNALAALQNADGSLPDQFAEVGREALTNVVNEVQDCQGAVGDMLRLSVPDLLRWQEAGLQTVPTFDETIHAIGTGSIRDAIGLLGVMRTPNSGRTGFAMEVLVGRPIESPLAATVIEAFDDIPEEPYAVRVEAGSTGFVQGECLVAFPENFKRRGPIKTQPFAVFIVDRFARLYREQALGNLPLVHRAWKSVTAQCDLGELEELRHVFAILHDRQHERGSRPLRTNLKVKMNHYCAILDEVRVDVHTMEDARILGEPLAARLEELIYLDRVVRLPRVPNSARYPDSAAGLVILSHLVREGVDLDRVKGVQDISSALVSLRDEIDAIEALPDDEKYQAAARHLVQRHLPAQSNVHRHSLPSWLRESGVHPHWPGGWLTSDTEQAA
jgi:hypothetical protein